MVRWVGCCLAALLACSSFTACGGGPSEPNTPDTATDPPLEDEVVGGVAEASSARVQEGIDAIQAEDFEMARSVLEKAVEEAPDDPQAVFYLGVSLAAVGEVDAAIEKMRRALELKGDFVDAHINLSALLLDTGRAEEALAAADAGLKHAPDDASLLQNRGLALIDTGDSAQAAEVLKNVVERSPDDEALRFVYAQALLDKGDEEAALKELDALSDSSAVPVLASIADLFGRSKAWDRCIGALDKAVEKEPVSELFVKRGLCKHGKEDEDGAKADFEKAVELQPDSPKGHFYLGQNLKARGDKKGAKAALGKAAELDPDGKLGKAAKKALAEL